MTRARSQTRAHGGCLSKEEVSKDAPGNAWGGLVFCPRLKILVFITTNLIFKILNVSLKFKSFEIWNLDKCSYCPEWTFYGNFFYIDLKYSFEFISSLFEDFLTTSRYWSFSNKTQLNWALKWFISNFSRASLEISFLSLAVRAIFWCFLINQTSAYKYCCSSLTNRVLI